MDINAIIAAIHSKQWIVLGAIFVLATSGVAKQGWLGTWIQSKLPPTAVPYFAVALGMLATAASEVIQGKPLLQALINGFESGAGAVFLHETVVEGMRNGKEIIGEKPPANLKPPPDLSKAA
jgi:hypothetical protein